MSALEDQSIGYYQNLGYDYATAQKLGNADAARIAQAQAEAALRDAKTATDQMAFANALQEKLASIQSGSQESISTLTKQVNDALSSTSSVVQNAAALGAYHEGLQSPNLTGANPGGNSFTPGSVAAAKSAAPYWLLAGVLALFYFLSKRKI